MEKSLFAQLLNHTRKYQSGYFCPPNGKKVVSHGLKLISLITRDAALIIIISGFHLFYCVWFLSVLYLGIFSQLKNCYCYFVHYTSIESLLAMFLSFS